jgi:hypothetical protein
MPAKWDAQQELALLFAIIDIGQVKIGPIAAQVTQRLIETCNAEFTVSGVKYVSLLDPLLKGLSSRPNQSIRQL